MQQIFLTVFVTLVVIASTYSEDTNCESHRSVSRASAHGLKWNIECDSNGKYKRLQCTDEPKEKDRWCTCYNEDEAVKGPSKKLRHCECPIARHNATTSNANACNTPDCEQNGKFREKQCCTSTGKCRCVDKDTGAQRTEPTRDTNLECGSH